MIMSCMCCGGPEVGVRVGERDSPAGSLSDPAATNAPTACQVFCRGDFRFFHRCDSVSFTSDPLKVRPRW